MYAFLNKSRIQPSAVWAVGVVLLLFFMNVVHAQENSGNKDAWVTGKDGRKYYAIPMTPVTLTKSSAPSVTALKPAERPLTQVTESRTDGNRIEARAYVRPIDSRAAECGLRILLYPVLCAPLRALPC